MLLSAVERCPLYRGIISFHAAFGTKRFARCSEVSVVYRSPLMEVPFLGGNLGSPWYEDVPSLGYLYYDRVRI